MKEVKTAENNTEQQPITVTAKLTGFISLYAVFVYVSGWAYSDSYLQLFRIDREWLDISIAETMAKGMKALFEGGGYLWFIYVFVVVVPVLFEVFPKLRRHLIIQVMIACLILSCLPLDYHLSQSAAESQAKIDQGDDTKLPNAIFELKCLALSTKYTAKLLYIKNGFYYLHDVRLFSEEDPSKKKIMDEKSAPASARKTTVKKSGTTETQAASPPETCITYGQVKQLTIVRAEAMQAFQIIEK